MERWEEDDHGLPREPCGGRPSTQEIGHLHQKHLKISFTLLGDCVSGLPVWDLGWKCKIVWKGFFDVITSCRCQDRPISCLRPLTGLCDHHHFATFSVVIWQGFSVGLQDVTRVRLGASQIGSMTASGRRSTQERERIEAPSVDTEERGDYPVTCTQLHTSREVQGQNSLTVEDGGTLQQRRVRPTVARAASAIRQLWDEGHESMRGPKKRCINSAMPGKVVIDSANLNTSASQQPEEVQQSDTVANRCCRWYTTSSQLQKQRENLQSNPNLREASVQSTPRSQSVAFQDCRQLVGTLFGPHHDADSKEVQGSGFVIVPDWRSVNVQGAGPSLRPINTPGHAPDDPLAYLDAIWTSQAEGSNNGPLLNKYCLPPPNVSEEYARPNPEGRRRIHASEDEENCADGDAGDNSNDHADRDDVAPVVSPAVTITGEIPIHSPVRVKLNCMEWGGGMFATSMPIYCRGCC